MTDHVDHLAKARARAERAQAFRFDEDYMESWPWFPVERADRADPGVRW